MTDDLLNCEDDDESLPTKADNDVHNSVVVDELSAFHLKRTLNLWKLHDRAVREAKRDRELTPAQLSQILQRCARAAVDIAGLDRKVLGAGDSKQGESKGVMLIPVKADPVSWAEVVAEEIDCEDGQSCSCADDKTKGG